MNFPVAGKCILREEFPLSCHVTSALNSQDCQPCFKFTVSASKTQYSQPQSHYQSILCILGNLYSLIYIEQKKNRWYRIQKFTFWSLGDHGQFKIYLS